MYEQFFGLNRPPFKITPDTSLFYDGGRRGDVLGALVYAVQRGEGIVKVVGEVGSGKTMLCRMLQQELPDSVEIIYIANPSVSADDILFVIAHELKLDVQKEASKHEVMHLLQAHLLKRFTGNQQVVLFVEEAQGMPLETLEEIRLLSNLETDQDKLLQIILFGQPELDENLKTSSIRQLKERITHEFNLTPLSDTEIHQYLNFRMREVGYTGPELISIKVAKIIGKYSGGLLRRINIMADKVLLAAYAESTHNVTAKHVHAAVKDSGFERSIDGKLTSSGRWFYVLLLIVLALVVLIFSGKFDAILASTSESLSATQKTSVKAEINAQKIEDQQPLQTSNQISLEKPLDELANVTENTLEPEAKVVIKELMSQEVDIKDTNEILLTDVIVEEAVQEDRLSAIILRKKKNSDAENLINKEEVHKKEENNKNNLSIQQENTKIEHDIADNKEEQAEPLVLPEALGNSEWISWKLKESKSWLSRQPNRGVSIQVMMRSKNASDELAEVLRNQWPLDVEKTYLYEVNNNENKIYRIFYGGFKSLSLGQQKLKELPEQIRLNEPYLHSIYKMKKTLL